MIAMKVVKAKDCCFARKDKLKTSGLICVKAALPCSFTVLADGAVLMLWTENG